MPFVDLIEEGNALVCCSAGNDRIKPESCNEAQAPTAEMAVAPPSIRKSAPTTYAESSDAR